MAGSLQPENKHGQLRNVLIDLLIIAVVAAIPRLAAVAWTVAPARDAFRFIDAAQLLQQQPFLDAVRQINVHPLYPLTLIGAHHVWTSVTGSDDAYAWLYAGQLWSVVSYIGFLFASYAAGSQLWGRRLALLGCLAISLTPRQVSYSADLLSDSFHAAMWMTAFAFVVCAWRRQSGLVMALGAFFAAAAYWTRVEAVLLPLTVGATAVTAQLLPAWRLPWRQWAKLLACFSLCYLPLAGAYSWTIGRISARSTAMVMLGVQVNPAPMITELPADGDPDGEPGSANASSPPLSPDPVPQAATPASLAEEALEDVDLVPHEYTHMVGYERAPWWLATFLLFKEIGQETRGWLLAFVALALVCRCRTKTAMPGGLFVFFAVCGCAAMLIVLRMRAGYIAGRYMTPILPLLSIYAMTGIEAAVELLRRPPSFPWEATLSEAALSRLRQAFVVVTVWVVGLILCVPGWLKPLHRHRYGHMQAARWLREHTRPGDMVFDPSRASAFFAGRPQWLPNVSVPARLPFKFAVIDPSLVYRSEPLMHQAIRAANDQGRVVAQFPRKKEGTEVGVYVLRLDQEAVSQKEPDTLR